MAENRNQVLTGTHFMLGNYAIVEGALAAGCNFFAGYPITPANEISERMAVEQKIVCADGERVFGSGRFCRGT